MFFGCRQNTTHFFLQLSNTVAYFLPSARWVWGRLSCHGTQWPLCWLSLRRVCSGAVSCWRSKWKHQPANTLWWHLRTPTDTGPYSSNMYIHCMIGAQLTYPHHPCTCVNFMIIQDTPLHWGWAKVLATRSASSAELMGQAGGCKATLRTLPAKSGCAKHMHLCAKHQNSRLAKAWILLSKAVWGIRPSSRCLRFIAAHSRHVVWCWKSSTYHNVLNKVKQYFHMKKTCDTNWRHESPDIYTYVVRVEH